MTDFCTVLINAQSYYTIGRTSVKPYRTSYSVSRLNEVQQYFSYKFICEGFGVQNLFCEGFGVQNLFCEGFGMQNLFCEGFGVQNLFCFQLWNACYFAFGTIGHECILSNRETL